MLIDTHCHIQESDYPIPVEEVLKNAHLVGVDQIICVGDNYDSSKRAVDVANKYEEVFATIGIHPYYDDTDFDRVANLIGSSNKIVAIGEAGLDYHGKHLPAKQQISLFERQLDLAIRNNLPVVFHVRDAYDDFWSVVDNFSKLKGGLLHCFTGSHKDLEKGLARGYYFAINGISTYSNLSDTQRQVLASIPLDKLVLETDAPYLTPEKFRGKIKVNEPACVREIARANLNVYNQTLDDFATATSNNARSFFNLKSE